MDNRNNAKAGYEKKPFARNVVREPALGNVVNPPSWRHDTILPLPMEVKSNAWAVDAACSGNPGPMEYRCIDLATGAQVFHFGPVQGTNNIGEFLAIVHALALMDKQGIRDKVIYSDSTMPYYGSIRSNVRQSWNIAHGQKSFIRLSPGPNSGSAHIRLPHLL